MAAMLRWFMASVSPLKRVRCCTEPGRGCTTRRVTTVSGGCERSQRRREPQRDRRAPSGPVGGVGGPTVCLRDRERDRKAEAGTAAVHARAGVVGPPEALERIRKKLGWEAGSVVEHFDHRAAVFT